MKSNLVAVAVIAAVAFPGSASAAIRCGTVPFASQSDNGAFQVEAQSTDCGTARMVAGASRPTRFRSRDSGYAAFGFSCLGRAEQLGGAGKYVVKFRCLRQRSSVSFLRG